MENEQNQERIRLFTKLRQSEVILEFIRLAVFVVAIVLVVNQLAEIKQSLTIPTYNSSGQPLGTIPLSEAVSRTHNSLQSLISLEIDNKKVLDKIITSSSTNN